MKEFIQKSWGFNIFRIRDTGMYLVSYSDNKSIDEFYGFNPHEFQFLGDALDYTRKVSVW